MSKTLLALLCATGALSAEVLPQVADGQEFVVDLKEPTFVHGVIATDQGGVVTAKDLRIQAQKIEYINKIENGRPVKKVIAEGDLMMEYGPSVFVGKRLEYDFISHTGILLDGKTFVDAWFLGGERLELREDGSYYIYNAYITTCESQENTWDVHAGTITITKNHLLAAKNIKFRFIHVPIFWIPSFRSNLKFFSDPPIKYKLVWDKGIGPRATVRYRVLSWEYFNLYFRLDYRLKRGFGAAIESEHHNPDGLSFFRMKNYAAHDKLVPDEQSNKRYRLQGFYKKISQDGKTVGHLIYDKMSDDKMPSDFKNDDFEVDTQKRSRLFVTHQRENLFASFSLQPRINSFQSLDQELPLINTIFRPIEIGSSGVIFESRVSGGYLDYVFIRPIQDVIPHRHALRLETQNQFYRPFRSSFATFTPYAGGLGIFYSNSPAHHALGQGLVSYGFMANSHLNRPFTSYRHRVEPYLRFDGLTRPAAGTNKPFIFSIDDGFTSLNQLRVGIRQFLFKKASFLPTLDHDLYTYGFFHKNTFANTFPKAYTSVGWQRSFLALRGGLAYNIEENLWDYCNARADCTINEHCAFGVEFRHRSRFDWRKADHESFILDMARNLSELLHSPVSDGRNTFLTRLFIRLSPDWSCLIQSHSGWGRRDEPSYNEANIDLYTMLTSSWRLKVSYRYTPNEPFHMTAGLSLVK